MANSVANFIPEVWSLNTQKILDKICVMLSLVNRDYEGEIKRAGDTVHVRTFGDITINTYTRNSDVTVQDITDPMSDLTIDQQKSFAIAVDSLDDVQSDINIMKGYADRAAQGIKEVIDQHLHSHYADAPASATFGSSTVPINITKDNIYSNLTYLRQLVKANNGWTEGQMNLAISPAFENMILNAPEFTRSTVMADEVIKTGRLTNIAGWEVYVSTNLNTANGNTPLLGFSKWFISYASQFAKVKPFERTLRFEEGLKGLYLYGSKVFTNTSSSKGVDKSGGVLWAAGT